MFNSCKDWLWTPIVNPPLNARDTMNTVQRMESASKAGCIHVSKSTKELLPKERWEHTGGIEVSKQQNSYRMCIC